MSIKKFGSNLYRSVNKIKNPDVINCCQAKNQQRVVNKMSQHKVSKENNEVEMDVETFRNDLSNLFEDQISNLVFCIIQTINLTYVIDYLVFIL